jgi:catechol 2,3-dioxygenase-like lactoylglutathione lyase family enzyme
MLDHASLGVRDLERSTAFYAAVLAPLGLVKLAEREGRVGFGKRYPELWLNHRPRMPDVADDTGHHLCLRAPSESAVLDFHAAALANGARDDGAPGPRHGTMTAYFAAFIRDPDGNRIEAAVFPGAGSGKGP